MIQEERQELMRLARELHAELQAHNKRVNVVINHLLSEADRLKLAALAGVTESPKVTRVEYRGSTRTVAEATHIPGKKSVPPDYEVPNGTDTMLQPGKPRRACSLCRQPGHRAKNCPNAHLVQAQKKQAAAAREALKPKKRRSS